MSRPTILHCIPTMGGGGAERQLGYLAHSLSNLAWDVHVAFNRDGPNLTRLSQSGATIHRLNITANHDPRLALRIAALIRRVQPKIVQTWLPQMDIAGGLVATMLNVPWILSERSSAASYPRGAKTQLRRKVARSAAAIIANSRGGARYWSNGSGAGRRCFVVPNGVPLDDIAAASPADLTAYGIDADEQVVVFAGRFSPEKNIPLLIDALEQAGETCAFKALLCGDGPLLGEMQSMVRSRGLAERVILPGYVDEMWGLLKRASAFVSVSSYEGHPNGVIEALACGCALVVSDIDAHRACVTSEVAKLVPLDNVVATRDAILQLLRAQPSDKAAVAVRARTFAQQWSLAEIGSQYHAIYGSILGTQPVRLAAQAS